MSLKISFQKTDDANADTIVIGVYQNQTLSDAAELMDNDLDGFISNAMKSNSQFSGKNGEILNFSTAQNKYQRIIAVGLGAEAELTPVDIETAGGKLFDALKKSGSNLKHN